MVDVSHLRLENISKSFGSEAEPLSVLEGVNLDVAYGEFLSLLGPSGCGKSTLLKMIVGMEEITDGTIAKPKGLRIGYLAQHLAYREG